MTQEDKLNLYFKLFTWVLGIIILAIGWLFSICSAQEKKMADISSYQTKLDVQLSQIQTDLIWIKQKLSEDKDK